MRIDATSGMNERILKYVLFQRFADLKSQAVVRAWYPANIQPTFAGKETTSPLR